MSQQAELSSLAGRAVRGVAWAFATTIAIRVISLLSLAVLARLLVPEQFGLVAFALVFLTYAETVGDLGMGAALIFWPERRNGAAEVSFWIGLAMGFLWFGLTQVLASPVALFFRTPEAEPILRVLAWSFPLKALGHTHDALCQKELRFKARLVPETAMFVVKGGVAIALALAGFGVWSLVWGQLAGVASRTVVLWLVVPWRPARGLPVDLALPMLRYGRGIIAVNVLAAVLHHADLVIVGRRLGAEALGLYQIASKVPEMTVALLIWAVARVLFPTLSRVQHAREQLRRVYLEALRWVALLAIPASVGLFMLAEPLLLTLFGEAWRSAASVLRALAVYTGLRALGSHAGDLLKATGRPQLLASLGVLKAGLLLPALIWSSTYGAVAVAQTLALVTGVTVSLSVGVVAWILELRLRDLWASLQTALPGAVVLIGVLALWSHVVRDLPALVVTAGGGILGLSVYLLTLHWASPQLVGEALRYLSRRQGRSSETIEPTVVGAEAP